MAYTYNEQEIRKECSDPAKIQRDLEIISEANRMHFEDCGWEQLQNRCYTQAARSIISQIEIRKYRAAEYVSDKS